MRGREAGRERRRRREGKGERKREMQRETERARGGEKAHRNRSKEGLLRRQRPDVNCSLSPWSDFYLCERNGKQKDRGEAERCSRELLEKKEEQRPRGSDQLGRERSLVCLWSKQLRGVCSS